MTSFRVELEDVRSGQVWPQVTYGGITYVVAQPNTDFVVKVVADYTSPPSSEYAFDARLKVDGRCPGYSKLMKGAGTYTFNGWYVAGGNRAFRTAKPADTNQEATTLQPLGEQVVGTIDVKVYLARRGPPISTDHRSPVEVAGPAAMDRLPDGKKFFNAPSLSSAAGSAVGPGMNWSTHRFVPVSVTPDAHVRLRYETASTLLLRGVLQASNPLHDAWINNESSCTEEVVGESNPGGAAAAAAERRVKRERQTYVPLIDGTEVVDLVGNEPGPRAQQLPPRDPDEILECDLTGGDGEDGGQPLWTAHKRRREIVELGGGGGGG